MAKVSYEDHTKRWQTVRIELDSLEPDRVGMVPHLQVHDIIAFAKELEEADAPPHAKVVFTEVRPNTGLLKLLQVDWKSETINGEPPPQAVEREQT